MERCQPRCLKNEKGRLAQLLGSCEDLVKALEPFGKVEVEELIGPALSILCHTDCTAVLGVFYFSRLSFVEIVDCTVLLLSTQATAARWKKILLRSYSCNAQLPNFEWVAIRWQRCSAA